MNRDRIRGKALAVAAAAVAALGSPGAASADTVTDWNGYATTSIVGVARQPPHASVLSFAMVQSAVYDAVNSIARTHRPYLAAPAANPWDSQDAAAATAAYRVLAALFPAQVATLQPLYESSLAAVPDGPARAGGVAAGEAAAGAMLAARANDGRGVPFPVVIGSAPGAWRPTPPLALVDPAAWVANVRPFIVPSAEMLRSDGPDPSTSKAYAKDLAEVARVGSLTSTKRTPDQTAAALFWATDHPGALYGGLFRSLAASQGLDSAETARLLAMVWLAAADAAIGCWNDKYYWNFWRPITAIQEAASDGNPATRPDPAWTPLLVTPPFPEHPSGHACASTAIVLTLAEFFGTDKLAFTIVNNTSQTARSFDRFSHVAREVVDARVWGGIHFRTADQQGAEIGKKVARWLRRHYFDPVK